jgi:hypothetical protein
LYPAEIYEAFKKSGLCFPTTRLKLNPWNGISVSLL